MKEWICDSTHKQLFSNWQFSIKKTQISLISRSLILELNWEIAEINDLHKFGKNLSK